MWSRAFFEILVAQVEMFNLVLRLLGRRFDELKVLGCLSIHSTMANTAPSDGIRVEPPISNKSHDRSEPTPDLPSLGSRRAVVQESQHASRGYEAIRSHQASEAAVLLRW